MIKKEKTLDLLYVASPCSADWAKMQGNEKVRYCNKCHLNVYNISMMSRKEAERLIANVEGRLCTKLYRRVDGTIITKDCPFGIHAIKRRTSRLINTALGVVLTLFASQTVAWADRDGRTYYKTNIIRLQSEGKTASIRGVVFYMEGKGLVDAEVTLVNEETNSKITIKTSDKGEFSIFSLSSGSYSLYVEARGFVNFKQKSIKVNANESLQLEIMMQAGTVGGVAFRPENQTKDRIG